MIVYDKSGSKRGQSHPLSNTHSSKSKKQKVRTTQMNVVNTYVNYDAVSQDIWHIIINILIKSNMDAFIPCIITTGKECYLHQKLIKIHYANTIRVTCKFFKEIFDNNSFGCGFKPRLLDYEGRETGSSLPTTNAICRCDILHWIKSNDYTPLLWLFKSDTNLYYGQVKKSIITKIPDWEPAMGPLNTVELVQKLETLVPKFFLNQEMESGGMYLHMIVTKKDKSKHHLVKVTYFEEQITSLTRLFIGSLNYANVNNPLLYWIVKNYTVEEIITPFVALNMINNQSYQYYSDLELRKERDQNVTIECKECTTVPCLIHDYLERRRQLNIVIVSCCNNNSEMLQWLNKNNFRIYDENAIEAEYSKGPLGSVKTIEFDGTTGNYIF